MLLLSRVAGPCKMPIFPEDAVAARLPCAPNHAGPPTGSPRQGARYLRFQRLPRDRRDRSHLGLRLRARIGNPGQRIASSRRSRCSGSRASRTSFPTTSCLLTRPTTPNAARRHADLLRGRSMLVRKADPLPIECVARGYLAGSGWKDYQATGEVCGIAPARRLDGVGASAAPDLHAGHKGPVGPRHQHQRGAGGRDGRSRCAGARSRSDAAAVPGGLGARRVGGDPGGRHEVRVRPAAPRRPARGGAHHPYRRSPDAGFVALLADGRRTRPAVLNPASTSSSCATTSSGSTGTSSHRCLPCPTTWSSARGTSISKPSGA